MRLGIARTIAERNVAHAPIGRAEILRRVRQFYVENSVENLGLTAEDFSTATMKALQ